MRPLMLIVVAPVFCQVEVLASILLTIQPQWDIAVQLGTVGLWDA
jgi:hypothetical protein